jgi:23S rRNA pseudouridine2605 synthase
MIRLQKLLAAAGLGSRRTVEEWIRAGRVSVAGRIAQLGDRAAPTDDVRLDGRRLALGSGGATGRELLLYYKPVGQVTTRSDPEGRPTVFERLPPPRSGRWISVGRLDVNTSGLLLLTNDGELAHRLMHPSGEIEREYLVRLRGRPGPETIDRLLTGVELEDGPARFDQVIAADDPDPPGAGRRRSATGGSRPAAAAVGGRTTVQQRPPHVGPRGSHSAFRVVLREGRNREVRRLWQAVGFEVSRLRRIRYGPIELSPDMRPGSARRAPPALLESLAGAVSGRAPRAPHPHPERAPRASK